MHGLQKARNKELEARVEALLNERDVLKGRVQQLKVRLTSDAIAAAPHCLCNFRRAFSSIPSAAFWYRNREERGLQMRCLQG